MPRLTPEELREAKRLKADERRQQEAAEEARLIEENRQEKERMAREYELQEKHDQLESYVNGIYDEIAKLSIKWPTQPVNLKMKPYAGKSGSCVWRLLHHAHVYPKTTSCPHRFIAQPADFPRGCEKRANAMRCLGPMPVQLCCS